MTDQAPATPPDPQHAPPQPAAREHAEPQPHPAQPQPQPQPQWTQQEPPAHVAPAQPQTYAAPPAYAPPGAAPQAYAAPGYAPTGYAPAGSSPQPASRTLGVVAFALSLAAAVLVPIVGAVAAWRIGAAIGVSGLEEMSSGIASSDGGTAWLAVLAPVRGDVLLAEIAFWSGTVLGIWAIAQGIVAVARRHGRGFGVAAIVVAAVGPVVYFVLLWLMFAIGAASSIPPNA